MRHLRLYPSLELSAARSSVPAANSEEAWLDAFSPIDPADDEEGVLTPHTSKLDKCALARQHKQQHKRHLKKVRKQIAAARRRRK